ncbi:MAG TPA: hypothetical protein VMS71_07275 [Candidatus Acidoferrum sp.]|nr:hypothetical protein [Candidatus Acidoferrum sp.]
MQDDPNSQLEQITDSLHARGYWPALAARALADKKYSTAVELCKNHLSEEPHCISGRLIYATALYQAGQTEAASDQYYQVLARDPENIVALKYLSDIAFAAGDEMSAMSGYKKILEIDPFCCGIRCELTPKPSESSRTITLTRGEEQAGASSVPPAREIPFYTETMADLYLAQGYPRLAAAVYTSLIEKNKHPRLLDKLARAESKLKEKRTVEHVRETD